VIVVDRPAGDAATSVASIADVVAAVSSSRPVGQW
jgi:hypothetical protein